MNILTPIITGMWKVWNVNIKIETLDQEFLPVRWGKRWSLQLKLTWQRASVQEFYMPWGAQGK